MTEKSLKEALRKIDKKSLKEKEKIIKKYCDRNNNYNIGDVFTDNLGSIIIEKINYYFSYLRGIDEEPCCLFAGTNLNKDGSVNVNEPYRITYQSNE
jgi:hypothetical protein